MFSNRYPIKKSCNKAKGCKLQVIGYILHVTQIVPGENSDVEHSTGESVHELRDSRPISICNLKNYMLSNLDVIG